MPDSYVQYNHDTYNDASNFTGGHVDNTLEVTISVNGTLANATTGNISSYLVYTALLTQGGTNAPTAIILGTNTIGNIVWTRSSAGTYLGTLTGAFPDDNKLIVLVGNSDEQSITAGGSWGDGNSIVVRTALSSTGTKEDDWLYLTPVEIRIYIVVNSLAICL